MKLMRFMPDFTALLFGGLLSAAGHDFTEGWFWVLVVVFALHGRAVRYFEK